MSLAIIIYLNMKKFLKHLIDFKRAAQSHAIHLEKVDTEILEQPLASNICSDDLMKLCDKVNFKQGEFFFKAIQECEDLEAKQNLFLKLWPNCNHHKKIKISAEKLNFDLCETIRSLNFEISEGFMENDFPIVWRGASNATTAVEGNGFAWTTDRKIAAKFGLKILYKDEEAPNPLILKARATQNLILCIPTCRSEGELILDYTQLSEIEIDIKNKQELEDLLK